MHPSQRKMKIATLDNLPSVTRPAAAKLLRKTRAHSLTEKGSTADNARERPLGTIVQQRLEPLDRRVAKAKVSLQDKEDRTAANEQEAVHIHRGRLSHSRGRVKTPHQARASVSRQRKHTVRNDDLQKEPDNFDARGEEALVTPDPGLLNNKSSRESSVLASFRRRQANMSRGVEESNYTKTKVHSESSLPPLGILAEKQDHQQVTIPVTRSKPRSPVLNNRMVLCQQTPVSYSFTPGFDNSAHAPIYHGAVQPSGRCAAQATAADLQICDLESCDMFRMCARSTTVTRASFADVDCDDMDVTSSSRSSSCRSYSASPHGHGGPSRGARPDGESLCQNLHSRCVDCGSTLADVADIKRCSSCGWKQVDSIYMFASSSFVKNFVPSPPRQNHLTGTWKEGQDKEDIDDIKQFTGQCMLPLDGDSLQVEHTHLEHAQECLWV